MKRGEGDRRAVAPLHLRPFSPLLGHPCPSVVEDLIARSVFVRARVGGERRRAPAGWTWLANLEAVWTGSRTAAPETKRAEDAPQYPSTHGQEQKQGQFFDSGARGIAKLRPREERIKGNNQGQTGEQAGLEHHSQGGESRLVKLHG